MKNIEDISEHFLVNKTSIGFRLKSWALRSGRFFYLNKINMIEIHEDGEDVKLIARDDFNSPIKNFKKVRFK